MTRTITRTLKGVGLMAAVAMLAGCQSSELATLNVRLVDGPALEYSELNVHVLRVEIAKAGEGWITLGEPVPVRGGVELEILSARGEAQPGFADNLIVEAFLDPPADAAGTRDKARRTSLGYLPAVPFEIVRP